MLHNELCCDVRKDVIELLNAHASLEHLLPISSNQTLGKTKSERKNE